MKTITTVTVTPRGAVLDGKLITTADISGIYRELIGGYPKFFKMDMLCRLGFVAAELLLRDIPAEVREEMAVVLFNRSGSAHTDRNYQQTIMPDNYFPSPALFVYTLANIVTGEIAIRHKIYGETSMHILDREDEAEMESVAEGVWCTSNPPMLMWGWLEYDSPESYRACFKLGTK